MIVKRRVALLVETATEYGRQILAGIAKHQKESASWSAYLDERELRAAPPDWFFQRRWDGAICRGTTPELAVSFRSNGIPVVDLNDLHDDLGLPRIQSDMREIGRMGARHLRERGYEHFAFCGFSGETWAEQRREGFCEEIVRRGGECQLYESAWRGERAPRWDAEQQRLTEWLKLLPRPVGVMACNDVRGQHVLNACLMADIYVPEQVAVLGVDNNTLLCDFCNPPLSSVRPDPQRIGYEAAQLLDRIMSGAPAEDTNRLIPPLDVVMRLSTDARGIADPVVVAAIATIREAAFAGVTVADVAERLGVSRSSLERRFRTHAGRSPQQEIRNTQVERIKELLAETDLTLSEIARLTGFTHTEYMTVVFKRMTGQPPSRYRAQMAER